MTRILLADDHAIVRNGIRKSLEDIPGLKVSAEVGASDELLQQLNTEQFDLLIMDISMPGRSGLDVLPEIKRRWPKLPVLIYTMHTEEELMARAFKAGVAGYLTKDRPLREFLEAVKEVISEGRYVSKLVGAKLATHLACGEKPAHEHLSPREFEVLTLLAVGRSLKEIAGELSLNTKTISTYRTRVLEKMHLRTNADLTRYAVENHILRG
jgi:DNA-binding NarL/FixJ family response regulator